MGCGVLALAKVPCGCQRHEIPFRPLAEWSEGLRRRMRHHRENLQAQRELRRIKRGQFRSDRDSDRHRDDRRRDDRDSDRRRSDRSRSRDKERREDRRKVTLGGTANVAQSEDMDVQLETFLESAEKIRRARAEGRFRIEPKW